MTGRFFRAGVLRTGMFRGFVFAIMALLTPLSVQSQAEEPKDFCEYLEGKCEPTCTDFGLAEICARANDSIKRCHAVSDEVQVWYLYYDWDTDRCMLPGGAISSHRTGGQQKCAKDIFTGQFDMVCARADGSMYQLTWNACFGNPKDETGPADDDPRMLMDCGEVDYTGTGEAQRAIDLQVQITSTNGHGSGGLCSDAADVPVLGADQLSCSTPIMGCTYDERTGMIDNDPQGSHCAHHSPNDLDKNHKYVSKAKADTALGVYFVDSEELVISYSY